MGEDDYTRCCERQFWMDVVVSAGLVLFAGLTSGLSLGLLSHSKVDLEVLVKAGLPKDRKNAAKILPIVKNECFLLCTLLIAKSLATEALPLFLDRILPFWGAILVSIILVVAFVEVIPQAVCTRHGLSFSAKFTVFVRFLLLILLAVSYPVSKVLDWLLGENQPLIFRRAELKTLVDLHRVKVQNSSIIVLFM
ncbi:CBS domain protein with a domain protein [Perilla frutescens var. frutescens]|nr:CBS domain protein with a domain protein [Perilla frutescens var. frutescens]